MMIESSGYLTRLYQLRAKLCRREVCDYLTTLKSFNVRETYEGGWTFCMILNNLFLSSTSIYILIYIERFYNYLFVLR